MRLRTRWDHSFDLLLLFSYFPLSFHFAFSLVFLLSLTLYLLLCGVLSTTSSPGQFSVSYFLLSLFLFWAEWWYIYFGYFTPWGALGWD